MTDSIRCYAMLPLILLGALLMGGCLPAPSNQLDEYKEYHYLAGKSHASASDFKAAIESYQKALEANPQSGAAHFELAWIYDEKETDPAAAIYHYSRFLQLRPTAVNADMVRTRMLACKQELARTVSLGPVTRELERDINTMATENAQLRAELTNCRTQCALLSAALSNAPAQAVRAINPRPGTSGPTVMVMTRTPTNQVSSGAGSSAARPDPVLTQSRSRTHQVRQGDTAAAIARRYNIKLSALETANPRMNPSRLQIGQVLNIPPAN